MKLFDEFSPQSYAHWKSNVDEELKGLSFDETLSYTDEIENITFRKFDNTRSSSASGMNFSRASRSQSNDWKIGKRLEVKDEKVANKMALEALNQGANSLTFVFQKKGILFAALFKNIGLDYIDCQFETLDIEQSLDLQNHYSEFCKKHLVLLNDHLGKNETLDVPSFAKGGNVLFKVDAFGLHQAGANATEEIAFALACGHEYLHQLLKAGFSIDDASAMIRFNFGIGTKYFIEASKFRVFRKLWSTIIEQYTPKEKCSHACYIYATTGFVNKSLKDPYTNLLRQTTEAMSAVLGGANEVYIRPYDEFAQTKEKGLSERIALNISNILKEESYFDKVIDPLAGSYSMEALALQLQEKAWSLFQNIEKNGGITSQESIELLQSSVKMTSSKRIEKLVDGERMLIGVNKYPSPKEESNTWLELPTYFGLEALILEKHTK